MKIQNMILSAILFIVLGFGITIPTNAEDTPETVNTICLKDGTVIKCDMGWPDGATFYYRKYGATIGIPLKRVDLDKTYKKSVEKEDQWERKEAERKATRQEKLGTKRDYILLSEARTFSDGSTKFGDFLISKIDFERIGKRGSQYKCKYSITNDGDDACVTITMAALDSRGRYIKKGGYVKKEQRDEDLVLKTKFHCLKNGESKSSWISTRVNKYTAGIIDKWRVVAVILEYPSAQ